ncbi:MAG: TVP38/TMEM64 family protein [Pseudomonadota bacterium]
MADEKAASPVDAGGAIDSPAANIDGQRDPATDDAAASSSRFRWTKLWPLGLIGAAMLGLYLAGVGDYLALETIVREHETLAAAVSDNIVVSILTYLAVYILAVAVSFPGASLITIVGGFLFGAFLGTALTVVAATAGATVLFLAAKTSVGAFLRAKVSGFAGRFSAGFEENAFSYLFLLRVVPLFPFWLINVAPTLFNVSLGTYVAATALGIIPGTFAYSLVGDGLGATIRELEADNPGCAEAGTCEIGLGVLFSPGLLLAMGALVIVAFIPIVVKRVRARQDKPL